MLCELSKQFEKIMVERMKKELIQEIVRLEQLELVYSDRDRIRFDEINKTKRELEMQLLEVM